jgi:hypothetical protein
MTVAVDAPEDILLQRLIERWQAYGLPPPEIKAKVEGNDLPNGRYVVRVEERTCRLRAALVMSGRNCRAAPLALVEQLRTSVCVRPPP